MERGQRSEERARLATFMLGHFSVDFMSGLLPALYPLLARELGLDYSQIGTLALAYTAAVSLTQPFFGYLADRWGVRRLAPLSLLWSGIFLGLYGLVRRPELLYPFAFLAGFGSGAYHPIGASRAAALAREHQRNTTMSIYTVSGTIGYALGPLAGVILFRVFGLMGTLVTVPIGLLAAALVRWGLGHFAESLAPSDRRSGGETRQAIAWRALLPILAVVMLRSWAFMTVATFAPVWYRELGYEVLYGVVATVIVASGAAGTLLGGFLADRLGSWRVLLGSLGLAIPALLAFAATTSPLGLLAAASFGLLADASISITLVAAQRLLPGRAGVASGFILGMGFVTGGIGAPVTGWIADRIGLQAALGLTALALVAALALCWSIPATALRRPALAPVGSRS
ncbi:MFS transporter [Thermomicrobium sp.]|jgi:FSR family fosmidomycin resistance protein-like MFS transporter|uniref:MFS transporter n=1 Tax=Thermomicrobium sp. TaxID=1969469 RepID=UPI001B02E17E|nr:MFS transporter [Thermomicrobium sp.]MBO9307774.1 MFS transporter [Thermomicrobium sp.]MBO9359815.1 MFS transporter [Thermomicrobium sp.]MBO9404909.1 MFS transporter [Thermomicrobium sp.]